MSRGADKTHNVLLMLWWLGIGNLLLMNFIKVRYRLDYRTPAQDESVFSCEKELRTGANEELVFMRKDWAATPNEFRELQRIERGRNPVTVSKRFAEVIDISEAGFYRCFSYMCSVIQHHRGVTQSGSENITMW